MTTLFNIANNTVLVFEFIRKWRILLISKIVSEHMLRTSYNNAEEKAHLLPHTRPNTLYLTRLEFADVKPSSSGRKPFRRGLNWRLVSQLNITLN